MAKVARKQIQQKDKIFSWKIVVPTIVAGLFLLVANSALWVNNVLFNNKVFTQTATEALLSESSRTSIASEVVNKALADRPVAQRVVAQPATKLIASLLDTNLAQTATTKVVSRLQTAVTTRSPQNIELDLTGVKNISAKLLAAAETADVQVRQPERDLPDTIVLFDASNVPNVYQYGQTSLILAPLFAFGGLLLLAYPHISRRSLVRSILVVQGAAIIVFGLLALTVGPIFRPMVLSGVESSSARVVVENMYNAFIQTFNQQTAWLFATGCILLVVPAGLWLYETQVKQRIAKRRNNK